MPQERYRYQVKCDYEEKTFFFDEAVDAREMFKNLERKHGDGVRLIELLERYDENEDEWFTLEEDEIKNTDHQEVDPETKYYNGHTAWVERDRAFDDDGSNDWD